MPAAANAADVDLAAVADHDQIHPDVDAPRTDHDGVTVIRGIELRVDTDLVEAAIDRHSLLATGGSDAHGTTLGQAGPPPSAVPAFRRRLKKR